MGELGCYGGGILRGADTARLDRFAGEGLQLLNFAPEAQCTPTRSALLTGRYAIRSGNGSVQLPGLPGGLVAWEQTMGDILSAAGYATAIYGKWHIGDEPGRYPTDHGFDEWYGIPHSYDECLWPDDPLYDPDRDSMSFVVASTKGGPVENLEQLTLEVRRDIDREYLTRADAFIRRSVAAGTPSTSTSITRCCICRPCRATNSRGKAVPGTGPIACWRWMPISAHCSTCSTN